MLMRMIDMKKVVHSAAINSIHPSIHSIQLCIQIFRSFANGVISAISAMTMTMKMVGQPTFHLYDVFAKMCSSFGFQRAPLT